MNVSKPTVAVIFYFIFTTLLVPTVYAEDPFTTQGNLSDQCYSETRSNIDNPTIANLEPTLSCIINSGEDTCTVDFKPISYAYRDTCLNEGGKYNCIDLKLICVNSLTVLNEEYNFLNYCDCVGASCTDSELDTYYTNYVLPYLEVDFVSNSFLLSSCSATDSNEMSIEANTDANTGDNANTGNGNAPSTSSARSNGMHILTTFIIASFVIAFIAP